VIATINPQAEVVLSQYS